ncbi:MAG: tRNA (N(6)-L-threonylcarbamoyladenosine(37)-C(2))-methylthiotransferase MtaB [Eubacterium sp.]|nr:tRNA (N(6)-L-threonylcarbamoyladenosine(37)-C(2))-methylthiotransferase MtaB [Eubacterium sp.]
MRVAFLTLGCKVNYYETEIIMEQFKNRGFEICEFSDHAEVYVVNTCTVTNMADRKSRQMIHRAKKKNPDSLVVAVGCYVESAGEKILEDASVDAAFSNKDKGQLAELIIQRFQLHAQGKTTGVEHEPKHRTRAYLKVQDGCNQFCTYCMIPYVRGRGKLVSTPEDQALEEIRALADKGYKEVVLTGIHLSSYGVDWSGEKNFVKLQGRHLLDLIKKAAQVPGIERIRLGSLEPRIIVEEFLQGLKDIPQFCPHFHLSLQSGSQGVLRRMNRHYTPVEYREKVDLIRQYFEHPAITTDVIVGFPGETEEEFQETRDFLDQIRLADIHVFPYSVRSGTRAAAMEGQVRPEIKKIRADILIEATKKYKEDYASYFLGKEEEVIFEETVVENDTTYLCGLNDRYVRIGITQEKAEEMGLSSGDMARVLVDKIFCQDN